MVPVTPLAEKMIALIRKDGPLRLDEFIRMALTDPEHGYYVAAAPIGAAADFITAPEVSQIFGELVGLWCVDRWLAMGQPDPFLLVELGPGRGVLMQDALRAASQASPQFRAAARLHLVETSVTLRADQRTRLGSYAPSWHVRLDDVPQGPMVAVANEFFDALPIRQLRRFGRGWQEQFVVVDAGERLFGRRRDIDYDAGRDLHPIYQRIPAKIVIEHAPERSAYALALATRIAEDGGAALVVDYGHRGGGVGSTLQSVRGHDHADVYAQPGAADITTHVDFGALARSAAESGCRIEGAVDQGRFLLNLGLAERLDALIRANPDHAESLRAGAYRLIDEEEMGSLFQALGIIHPSLGPTPGFQ